MFNRRKVIAGAAVLMAAGLAMSGCKSSSSSSSTASSTSSPSPSSSVTASASAPATSGDSGGAAKLTLAASLAKLAATGYNLKVNVAGGGSVTTGSVDPATKSVKIANATTAGNQKVSLDAEGIGSQLWMKMDLGSMSATLGVKPDKWMKVDSSKLTGPSAKQFDLGSGDAMDVAGLLSKMTDVEQKDATHYSGTVDLTAASGVSKPNASILKSAGGLASKVPFTVTLDDQGRPSNIKIDTTNSKGDDLSTVITFSNYGSPSKVTPPPTADVIPASNALYKILNGIPKS